MPFTKAQRLKGLKKQLRNMGYEVTKGGAPVGTVDESEDKLQDIDPSERGAHTLASMNAKWEGW